MNDVHLTHQIIGAAIDVHRELGPGLLEAVYEECLCYELTQKTIAFERQKPIPVVYKGAKLDCGYRADIIVCSRVIVEINLGRRAGSRCRNAYLSSTFWMQDRSANQLSLP